MTDDDWLRLFDSLYGDVEGVEHAVIEQLRRGFGAAPADQAALVEIFDAALRQKRELVLRLVNGGKSCKDSEAANDARRARQAG